MPRNLYERVEVMFPVLDPLLRERIRQEILQSYLSDTLKARLLQRDGSHARLTPPARRAKAATEVGFSAQSFLIGVAEGKQLLDEIPAPLPGKVRRQLQRRER
jgi:polyphosphate kinase